jgi:hypothetical protein
VPRYAYLLCGYVIYTKAQKGKSDGFKPLPLALFVLWIRTNHHHTTPSPDNAALVADFTDRCTNFHDYLQLQTRYFSTI